MVWELLQRHYRAQLQRAKRCMGYAGVSLATKMDPLSPDAGVLGVHRASAPSPARVMPVRRPRSITCQFYGLHAVHHCVTLTPGS